MSTSIVRRLLCGSLNDLQMEMNLNNVKIETTFSTVVPRKSSTGLNPGMNVNNNDEELPNLGSPNEDSPNLATLAAPASPLDIPSPLNLVNSMCVGSPLNISSPNSMCVASPLNLSSPIHIQPLDTVNTLDMEVADSLDVVTTETIQVEVPSPLRVSIPTDTSTDSLSDVDVVDISDQVALPTLKGKTIPLIYADETSQALQGDEKPIVMSPGKRLPKPSSNKADSKPPLPSSPPGPLAPVQINIKPPPKSPANQFPPCQICTDVASGFHYGVHTCESCKIFFRRSLFRKKPYKCAKQEKCEVKPGRRVSCSFCRLEKCKTVGMSRDGIKRGRYTLEKKMDTIMQVKQLQMKEKLQKAEEQQKEMNSRIQDLEELAQKIGTTWRKSCVYTKEVVEQIPKCEKEYIEKKKIEKEMFGINRPISNEAYQEFYTTTGIDIDGRRDALNEHVRILEDRIENYVDFAKKLPKFTELTQEDQIKILKRSALEWWMLVTLPAFNGDLYTSWIGMSFSADDLLTINSKEFNEAMFQTAKTLKKLNWTTNEKALVQALMIFSTDGVQHLDCPQIMEQGTDLLIEALSHQLKKNHPEDPHLLAKTILGIADIRYAAHEQAKSLETLYQRWPDLEYPPLFLEFMA